MATETLTCDAEGATTEWTANTGTKVAAVAADDGDSTYIDTSLGLVQIFTLSNPTTLVATSVIPYVEISGVFRKTSSALAQVTVWLSDGTNLRSLGLVEITSQSYATYTWSCGGVPAGNAAWAYDSLDGVQVKLVANAANIRCTELHAGVVNYLPAPFKFDEPNSFADARAGKFCAATGMWAPGHCLEQGYIKEYAPHDKTRGVYPKRPRTGKTF